MLARTGGHDQDIKTLERLPRVLLKTCGTTSPLDCLPRLLEVAREECDLTEIKVFNYISSREYNTNHFGKEIIVSLQL